MYYLVSDSINSAVPALIPLPSPHIPQTRLVGRATWLQFLWQCPLGISCGNPPWRHWGHWDGKPYQCFLQQNCLCLGDLRGKVPTGAQDSGREWCNDGGSRCQKGLCYSDLPVDWVRSLKFRSSKSLDFSRYKLHVAPRAACEDKSSVLWSLCEHILWPCAYSIGSLCSSTSL